jgi:uncharacterized protein YqeY
MKTNININGFDSRISLRMKCLAKHKAGERLTFVETALAMWDPKTEERPLTSMAICKIEQRALKKLKDALKEYGINGIDDMFENRHREFAHMNCEHETI